MKIFEKVVFILTVLGFLLMILLLPVGWVIGGLSLFALSFLYFYFGFAFFNEIQLKKVFLKDSYKGVLDVHIVGGILTGFALSVTIIAILFKFFQFPGASFMLIIGIVPCLIIFVVSLAKRTGTHKAYYERLLIRVTIAASLCIILFMMPRLFFAKMLHRDHPEYIRAVQLSVENPQDSLLRKQASKELNKMSFSDNVFLFPIPQ